MKILLLSTLFCSACFATPIEYVFLFEADLDGNGTPDTFYYWPDPDPANYPDSYQPWVCIFDSGKEMLLPMSLDVTPTPTLRDLDKNGLLDMRFLDTEGVAVWFTRSNLNVWHRLEADNPHDEDKDGLNFYAEAELGTDDDNSDTDNDTLPDGWEVLHGRDPLVADVTYFDDLRARAFPNEEPSIQISPDRTITITNLHPIEGLTITVQVSEDLQSWRNGAIVVSETLSFKSPTPVGFVRLAISEP